MPIDKLSANAFATGAVANSLGYTPANKAGDTFTGTVTANTLVVSTNTATFGTSAYHVANGFVGINGMSVPGYPLDVAGGSLGIRSVYGYESGTFINLRPEAANGVAVIGFGARSGNAPDLVFKRDDGAEVVRIMNSGGIKFPSTQIASSDANSLDDYEEGTWNPVWTGSTSGSGNFGNGTYIKIGRVVIVAIHGNNTTTPTFSGDLRISLPFPVSSSSPTDFEFRGGDAYWYPSANWDTQASLVSVVPYAFAGLSWMNLSLVTLDNDRQTAFNSSNSNLSNKSNIYLRCSLTYFTSS